MFRQVVFVALALALTVVNIINADSCGNPAIKPSVARSELIELLSGKAPAKIIGGTEARPNSWPWQVSVQNAGGSHRCGGSIINNQWILSAVHCCVDRGITDSPLNVKIRVGSHNLRSSTESKARTYSVSKVIPHVGYTEHPVPDQDFCLYKTSEPIVFSNEVSPVCLGEPSDNVVGRKCWVTGWGKTVAAWWASGSNILRQVDVSIVDQNSCDAKYRSLPPPNNGLYVSDKMLCAAAAGKDSCQGDSGGPFVCQNADGSYNLVGVVSWGVGCAAPGIPGVYAKTSIALDWIASTISDN